MKKETKENIKSNVATGASSAVGAGIGVVAGTTLANEVNAAEVPLGEEEEVEVFSSEPMQPVDEPVAQGENAEVEVVSYETVMDETGEQMDVAVVNVDGQPVMVLDIDQDGMADVLVADENGNGELEENEYSDVTEEGILMAPLQEAAAMNESMMLAQNQDYVNDADVADYLA